MKSSKENGKSKKSHKSEDSEKSEKDVVRISGITHEEIREKANEIYLRRIERGEYGTAEKDWIEAEKILREAES